MIGHLGTRVSALLDGQLSPADEERAWEHVHSCHQCRDAVEREGWVKTRLATMQYAGSSAPSSLKGSLLVHGMIADWDFPAHPALTGDSAAARRRHLGLSGIGSGAVGAAVMGVLALGASPANAPGAVVQPSGQSFGNALTSAVTSVIDSGSGTGSESRRGADSDRAPHSLARTLAP
ncbi:MAG TPA: zf-HC2 domain-containing protein [Nocardioides sp.]|nr:zf-HC2 domain-containing protein [Nocardioides sp.]